MASKSPKPARGRRSKRGSRANGAKTQARVLRVATAMFAASGYEATSLRQIASAADIDLATLKYHFSDKPTLFARVYSEGHERFLQSIRPVFESVDRIEDRAAMVGLIRALVERVHLFLDEHLHFARLVLYRLLEDSDDATVLEDELQALAIDWLEGVFADLIARGVIRAVDTRAFLTLLITSFPMWFVACEVKPGWVGDPAPISDEGRARSQAFFQDLLERMLLDAPA